MPEAPQPRSSIIGPERIATRKRTEFTDAQRARIFVRDRATCCFSGANLWLLDAPLRPGYERDWVDHVKPATRGGKTVIENGVCASHSYNSKKKNNGADTLFLFEEGLPTRAYYSLFGTLPAEKVERLDRLRHLTDADWFLNRAIGQILLGFDYLFWRGHQGYEPIRDDSYWFDCALKKLTTFRKLQGSTLEERGIVQNPDTVAATWLSLREVTSGSQLRKIANRLYKTYKPNSTAWNTYFEKAKTVPTATMALRKAESIKGVPEDTLSALRQDYLLRFPLHRERPAGPFRKQASPRRLKETPLPSGSGSESRRSLP